MHQIFGSLISFVLILMLAWTSPALCGEIHNAVEKNNGSKVRGLIKKDPDLVFSKDEDGFTPLHLAAVNGRKDIAEFLLSNRAEVNSRDNVGSTPLHQAAAGRREQGDLVKLLLAHGADINATDEHGLTPLHYATLADNRDAVKSLLDSGANANIRDNKVGDTALILAAANGYKEVAEMLLAHGADPNTPDDVGTPLIWATRRGHTHVAELIRQHGGHE